MSFKDGKINIPEPLNAQNLSEVIKGLAFHIAMEYIMELNDEYLGQDEWEFIIKAEDKTYTLKINLNEWLV